MEAQTSATSRLWITGLAWALLLSLCSLTNAADQSFPAATAPGASGLPAQRIRKQMPAMKVFGTDDRQAVSDTTQFPWSSIGVVRAIWTLGNGTEMVSSGTGTLVGNGVVLTAGHCVYDQTYGWADQITFIPAENGSQQPFGTANSIHTICQQAWVTGGDNRYDLALFVLDKPLGEQAGHMSVAGEADSFFVNRNLNTAGYPAETKPGNIQYHTSGAATDVTGGLIRDTMDSEPGQSGSPLWDYQPDGQTRTLVGVLTGCQEITSNGQTVDAYNVAVPISPAFAQWIEDNLTKYDTVTQNTTLAATTGTSATTDSADAAGAPVPSDTSSSTDATASADATAPAPACGIGAPFAALMAISLTGLARIGRGRNASGRLYTYSQRRG